MDCIVLPSNAKINLGLLLERKREDGYHDIRTIFQEIDLHDSLTFQKMSDGIHISSTDQTLPLDEQNLCFRAFRLLQEKLGIREGIEIHIDKRIPVGGGLGGGSSNAATTLMAACRLWEIEPMPDEFQTIAMDLGSDVPFFLLGGTALGTGRGEKLEPLSWEPDWYVVLVCPGIRVSTSWAYRQARISLTKVEKFTKFMSLLSDFSPHSLKANLGNDFEDLVFRRHPVLGEIKSDLYRWDAFYASMSGSGSTVIGLFLGREKAEKARTFFSMERKFTAIVCKPISSRASD